MTFSKAQAELRGIYERVLPQVQGRNLDMEFRISTNGTSWGGVFGQPYAVSDFTIFHWGPDEDGKKKYLEDIRCYISTFYTEAQIAEAIETLRTHLEEAGFQL